MKEIYYIGALALETEADRPLTLWNSDMKFLAPVLPVTAHVPVRIETVEKLTPPQGKGYSLPAMTIWQEDGRELRLYHESYDGEKYIMSCYENGAVTVFVQKDAWEAQHTKFRPWFYVHLEQLLLENQALVLHSASILYRGQAILFTAPSGTGKTTQTDLWHRYRNGVGDLNGDRTLLQRTPDGWQACGFPVYGSTVRCEQAAAPIGAIVIIRQAEKDRIRELSVMEKVSLLYGEITVLSAKPDNIGRAMDLIEQMAMQVRIVRLDCTMQERAVETLHHYLYGE
ncbi:MAG: hypothetical protein ACI4GO_08880 [Hominenteromicrobium sp.]